MQLGRPCLSFDMFDYYRQLPVFVYLQKCYHLNVKDIYALFREVPHTRYCYQGYK